MTTEVKIIMAAHPVMVTIIDYFLKKGEHEVSNTMVYYVLPGETPPMVYSTTTRTISVVDLDMNDPRLDRREGMAKDDPS